MKRITKRLDGKAKFHWILGAALMYEKLDKVKCFYVILPFLAIELELRDKVVFVPIKKA